MKSDKSNLHILTLNVQGVRDRNKQKRVFELAKQQKANILFIQETHLTADITSSFDQQFNGTKLHSIGTSNSRGVSILIHSSVDHKVLNTHCDTYGRLILVNIEIGTLTFSLINIYAPNNITDRSTFFKRVNEVITEYAEGTIILAGDFNEILDHKLDRINRVNRTIPKKTKASNSLGNIFKEKSLIDIWRFRNKRKIQFTWKRQILNEASRIDYFCISADIENKVHSCDIRPAQISKTSHLAVSLKLKMNEENRGPGVWKINNSLLKDKDYKSLIINTINNSKLSASHANSSPHMTWEKIKLDVREATQSYSKQKAKHIRNRCTSLENRLSTLHQLQDNGENNEALINKIIITEKELDTIYDYKAKGAQIRARVEWTEQGEKNTKYFLGLEKTRQTKKNICKLTSTDRQTLTDSTDILNEEVDYYSNLYESKISDTTKMKRYLDSSRLSNTLTRIDKQYCDQDIMLEECTNSLFSMKLNKSPGSDGLSVEFYQNFWSTLREPFMNALNESINKGELTGSQEHGILSLIFKSGDETKLGNWRPITLLNVDYKIIARTLAQRLQKVISKIISTDQNGYIKNRFIGFSIRQIQDIIDYAEDNNLHGVLLFLDYQKAFDSIEWNFMNLTLEKFGFGNRFINFVKMLYKHPNNSKYK